MLENIQAYLSKQGVKYVKPEKAGPHQEEMEALEKKALEPDGQKWKAKLNLDRIYLEGLLKNLKDTDKKRYEKIKTEII